MRQLDRLVKSLPFRIAPEKFQWYDNEWGYSNRTVDLAVFMGNKLRQSNPQKVSAKA